VTPLSIHQTSRTFRRGFELCIGNGLVAEYGKSNAQIPSIVCLSFAIELSIKSILFAEGNPSKGHNLKDLFEKLIASTQAKVIQQMGICDTDFRTNLLDVANAFAEWRYIYESPGYHPSVLPFLQSIWMPLDALAADRARNYFFTERQ
jgi:hypothetical protein